MMSGVQQLVGGTAACWNVQSQETRTLVSQAERSEMAYTSQSTTKWDRFLLVLVHSSSDFIFDPKGYTVSHNFDINLIRRL